MKTRTITVKVVYDMTEIPEPYITKREDVIKMVERDMVDHFGWDEGYEGLEVDVIDE